jgi:hypothetical protein
MKHGMIVLYYMSSANMQLYIYYAIIYIYTHSARFSTSYVHIYVLSKIEF